MKLLPLLFLFSLPTYAQILNKSINPKYLHTNFFKIFDDYYINGEVTRVRGVKYSSDEYIDGGNRFEIKTTLLKRAQVLGESVFEATAGDRYDGFGTAVHVGENFVLTNQHVLSTSRMNTTSCRSFSIKLNDNQVNKTLKCKKVHYCDKAIDFCLIEMQEHRRGYALKNQRPPSFSLNQEFSEKPLMMSIGNTRGFGLHAALGYGFISYSTGLALFYAPVFGGNSGGPVINANDEVVALVRAQSVELVSDKSYNVAIPIKLIKDELLKNVSEDVLSKLSF